MSRRNERNTTAGERRWCAIVLAIALASAGVPASRTASAATLGGVVSTRAAQLPMLRVTVDAAVCGTEIPDESILVNAAGQLANAVVTLVGVKATSPAKSAVVVNDRCRFVPRVQVLSPGATVRTSSKDAVLHTTTVQTANGRPLFSLALPAPGITMSKAVGSAGVARVTCNTHPWMRGWLVVTDEMSAVTDANGRFTMENVPPGTYELRVWHEALQQATRKVTIADGKPTTLAIELVGQP